MASAAEPQPDAAPQAPAVAPDPAPGTTDASSPQQPAPATPVQVTPQAPTASEEPSTPAAPAPTPQRTTPKPKPEPRSTPARARRDTTASRAERTTGTADPTLLMRVGSFLPGVQGDEDSPSHLVLLAAAALLALVMASGSMLSIAARMSRRPLR